MSTSLFSGFGIDLSEHHLRLAQVSWFDRIMRLREIILPEGLVVDEAVVDAEALQKIFVKEMADFGLLSMRHRLSILVPESRVFSTSFLIEKRVSSKALSAQYASVAQKEIPFPFHLGAVCFSQGAKEAGGIRASAYVVEKEILNNLLNVIPDSLFDVVYAEANTQALLRLYQTYAKRPFKRRDPSKLIAIVDVGHSWATLCVYTFAGSNLLSRTIAYDSLQEIPNKLKETIEEITFYLEQGQASLSLILLAGVEGADDDLQKELSSIVSDKTTVQPIANVLRMSLRAKKEIHTFGAAIGAALRSAHRFKFSKQHNFFCGK